MRHLVFFPLLLVVASLSGCDVVENLTGEATTSAPPAATPAQNPVAATPKPKPTPRDFRKEMYLDPPRPYDVPPRDELLWLPNLDEGRQLAQRENRPMLLLVHCPSGTRSGTFDEVLLNPPAPLAEKLRHFVTVELHDAGQLDLKRLPLHQYQDPDQTWWLWVSGPEGNIYSVFGLEGAEPSGEFLEPRVTAWLEQILCHHYDERRPDWKVDAPPVAEATPAVTPYDNHGYPDWKARATRLGYLRGGGDCICCHQAQDVLWMGAEKNRQYERGTDSWIWPPLERLGLSFQPGQELMIADVPLGSAASHAGIRSGDRICQLDRVRVFNETDLRSAFHRTWRFPGGLRLLVRRDQQFEEIGIDISRTHRRSPVAWRKSLSESVLATHPGIIPIAGPQSIREKLSLPPGLVIIPEVGPQSPAWQKGLREHHAILAFGDIEDDLTPKEFLTMFSITSLPGVVQQIKTVDRKTGQILQLQLVAIPVIDLPSEALDKALLRDQ